MAKIITFLLCLLLGSNVYADEFYFGEWYCTFNPQYGYWSCEIRHPQCQNQTQYQTLSCPIHQSGSINQTRTYTCGTQSWSAWTTTSNNCTQDPPTCVSSTETRQLTCPAGYNGLITESRTSICSDPYGSPTWTAWSTTLNTCTMTATNINNPVSPISPISPTNPNSVISQQITTAPLAPVESVTVQDLTATATSLPAGNMDATLATKTESNGTTSAPSPATSTTTTSDIGKAPEVPKGKEVVPGFGIVLSMQLLNSGYNLQQSQINESIKLIQEEDYGRQQNILLEFISSNDTGDYLFNSSANRWRGILRDNPLQRFDLDD